MKTITLFSIFTFCAYAQVTLSFSSGSSVKLGFTGSRDIVISGTPAAVQFTLNWTNNITGVSLSTASSANASGKQLTCGQIITVGSTFSQACLLVGLNKNLIQNGSIVTVNFSVPKTAPGPAVMNTTTTVPVPPLSTDPLASVAIATTGGAVSIPFVKVEDLNSDGIIDQKDLDLFYRQFTGLDPCSSGDINGDGKCDVLDAQLIGALSGN